MRSLCWSQCHDSLFHFQDFLWVIFHILVFLSQFLFFLFAFDVMLSLISLISTVIKKSLWDFCNLEIIKMEIMFYWLFYLLALEILAILIWNSARMFILSGKFCLGFLFVCLFDFDSLFLPLFHSSVVWSCLHLALCSSRLKLALAKTSWGSWMILRGILLTLYGGNQHEADFVPGFEALSSLCPFRFDKVMASRNGSIVIFSSPTSFLDSGDLIGASLALTPPFSHEALCKPSPRRSHAGPLASFEPWAQEPEQKP